MAMMDIKGVKIGPLLWGGGVLLVAARVLRIDYRWIGCGNFSIALAAAPMLDNRGIWSAISSVGARRASGSAYDEFVLVINRAL
jgi:hypothetical protein